MGRPLKLLVTGGSGQLGIDIVATAESRGWVVTAPSSDRCDLRDRRAVTETITAVRPDVVIHGAAFTAVDRCESEPELAKSVNDDGTAHVVDAAAAAEARLIYVSTDYVFDGTKAEPYVESDVPNPQSVYGQTKLAGETHVGSRDTIARTSWVVGPHGTNMVKTILRLSESHPELSFVDDQRGHPTFTGDLAKALCDLAAEPLPGVLHLTNQGAVSWFEFARAVLEAAGENPDRVSPIASADLQPPRPAPRPTNSVLANQAMVDAGRPLLGDFRESLESVVAQLLLLRDA